MTTNEQPKPTTNERIAAQFSFLNVWNRLGRVVTVAVAYFMGLGKPPTVYSFTEWCGFALALAGAVWTGDTKKE